MLTGACLLCGGAPDPLDPNTLLMVRGWAHGPCVTHSGLSHDQIAAMTPCCDARHSVQALCGSIVQRNPAVPRDEVWLADPQTRRILRYRLMDGALRLVPTEFPAPPAVAAAGEVLRPEPPPGATVIEPLLGPIAPAKEDVDAE